MLCKLCEGLQWLICTQSSFEGHFEERAKKWVPDAMRREWYECPGCGGTGVRAMAGPAIIYPFRARKKLGLAR